MWFQQTFRLILLVTMLVLTLSVGIVFAAPGINGVTFSPASGFLNAGDPLTVTISADSAGYTAGTILINGIDVSGTFTDIGGGQYTVTYTVAGPGIDTPVADNATIPISIVLTDSASNSNSPYTTSPLAGNTPAILRPGITNATFTPAVGTIGIGGTLTLTITADANIYTAGAITINGIAATNFTSIGGNQYTAKYTVIDGHTDRAANSTPISVILSNGTNSSLAYTTMPVAAPAIDAHTPVIGTTPIISEIAFSSTSDPLGIGKILTATITADAAGYTAGTITINGKDVSGTFNPLGNGLYSVTYTIAEGDTAAALTASVVLKNVVNSTLAYSNVPFTATLGAVPVIDAVKPVITGVTFSPAAGIIRAGQVITATITADADNYTAGTITINGKATSNFTPIGASQYTVSYTVAAGDANIRQDGQIPVSIVIKDTAGNESLPYTTKPAAIDSPAISGTLADTIETVQTDLATLTQKGISGIVVDEKNNKYYVVSQTSNQVYSINKATGTATIFAGIGGAGGYNGDSILATTAKLNEPTGIALDSTGNVYVADRLNHRIRKIDITTGLITTVAGNGDSGFYGDLSSPTSAALKQPTGIAIDAANNIYIADNGNYRVRKVTITSSSTTSTIDTIAGDGTAPTLTPYSLALRLPSGTLYITDSGNNIIQKLESGKLTVVAGDRTIGYSGDGGLATKAQLNQPTGIAIDKLGDIYFTDAINNSVRKITATTGVISTRAGSVSNPTNLEPAIPATFDVPFGLTADSFGNLYVTQFNNATLQMINTSVSAITTASPVGGSYSADTTVTLTANKTVKDIYYTLDTTDPLSSPTHIKYTGPFALNASKTIKFISVDLADNIETTNTATYTIKKSAPLTTVSPASGLYNATQSVILTANPSSATIYYTTDGITTPTIATPTNGVGSVTIPVLSTTTIKFLTVGTDGTEATVQTQLYTIDITTPTTTALPVEGLYNSTQTVTLTASEPTATIYYTTSGIAPTTSTTTNGVGSVSVPVSKTTTLKYFAVDTAGNKETVITKTYTIDTVTPVTTMSPAGNIFNTPQSVTLTANESTATIYYTTDGVTVPDTTTITKGIGSVTIAVGTTTTLMYFAADAAGNKESVASKTITIDAVVPTTAASVAAGTYNSAQTVTLTASKPTATIYYTISGTDPTTTTTTKGVGSVSVLLTKTTTLKYFAVDTAGNKEGVNTRAYTIDTVTPVTTVSPTGILFNAPQSVTLTASKSSATIYYTTDGVTIPDTTTVTKGVGSVTIAVNTTTTLKYFAADTAGNSESVTTRTITIDAVTPTTAASVPAGTYNLAQTVTLTASEPTATIYYSITGTDPTITSPTKGIGSVSVAIAKTTTLKYFAVDAAGNKEGVNAQVYTIDTTSPITTASVLTGVYANNQNVTLTASESTATIYYTTDGVTVPDTTTPTKGIGSVTITVNATTKLQYFAQDPAGNKETVKTQTYTIVNLTTSASPAGGNYAAIQVVTLSSNSPGATIYYTTDGTTPTVAGKTTKKYNAPISITNATSPTTVLQFFAIDKTGIAESPRSETYLIDLITPATTFECSTTGTASTIKLKATDTADATPQIKFIVNTTGSVKSSPIAAYALTDYTFPITVTENTIVKYFATDIAGNTELIKTAFCAIGTSTKPSIFLETLADSSTTDAETAGRKLYVRGNVAPFATTTHTINGTAVSVNSITDGSFTYQLDMPLSANTLTIIATNGTDTTTITRTITTGAATASTVVGTNNGVVGNRIRIPIILNSGNQASAADIDISYTASNLSPLRAELTPIVKSLNKLITYGTTASGDFRLIITDQPGNSFTPLPDGVVAYIVFDVNNGSGVTETLTNSTLAINRMIDVGGATMAATVANGTVNIKSLPGDSDATPGVTLKEVLDALWMMVDPINHPADGAVDLNADGTVSITELQKVLTTFINQ